MLLSVRYPSLLGCARPAAGRSRSCVVQLANTLSKDSLERSAAELKGLAPDDRKPSPLLTATDLHTIAQMIRTDFPELHIPIQHLVQAWLEAPIPVQCDQDPSKKLLVPRSHLLHASTSYEALAEFLKEQLGIAPDQQVKITFSSGGGPGEAVEIELTQQVFQQHPMAYIVGFSRAWFVSAL